MVFAEGVVAGVLPTNTFTDIGPTAQITIQAGQSILINASANLGSSSVGGAGGLNLYICTPATVGAGMFGIAVAQNTNVPMALSAVLKNPGAGTYTVGLCGQTNSANWNKNDWGYVTAIAY